MPIKSGFFNSVNGDRKYQANFFAKYFASFIGNGVFPNPASGLKVIANNDMTITIKPGKAWINGYVFFNDEDYILNIDVADGVLSRVDRIILRLDTTEKRSIEFAIKKGEFSSNPTPPELQRDADYYELALADISINKGTSTILQSYITDLRLSTELCGIVHGTVDQVDTQVLFDDYMKWINDKKLEFNVDLEDYRDKKQIEFEEMINGFVVNFQEWFDSIIDILDENTAGNLLLLIEKLREDFDNRMLPQNAFDYSRASQWADILIPDENRGRGLLQFLLSYKESSEEITMSQEAMLVIMEEHRFNKSRQVPDDYEQIILKLGTFTAVGQYISWIEELLSDHTRGIEKLELGIMQTNGSQNIVDNKYAINVIMNAEQIRGITNYRVDNRIDVLKNDLISLNNKVVGIDNKVIDLDTRVIRLEEV